MCYNVATAQMSGHSKISQRTDFKANILWAINRWQKLGLQAQKTIQRFFEKKL